MLRVGPILDFGIECIKIQMGLHLTQMSASKKLNLENLGTTQFILLGGLDCGFLNLTFRWKAEGEYYYAAILFRILCN